MDLKELPWCYMPQTMIFQRLSGVEPQYFHYRNTTLFQHFPGNLFHHHWLMSSRLRRGPVSREPVNWSDFSFCWLLQMSEREFWQNVVSFPSDNTPIIVGEVHSMSRLTKQLIVTVQKGCRVEKAQGVDCAQSPVPHRVIHHPSHQEEDY